MPDPAPTAPIPQSVPATPKRRRFARLWRLLFWSFLLMAIFHRPLFHFGVRFALIQVAARQNLSLEVHFSGNIWNHLNVDGIRAVPNNRAPTPVEKIEIERVSLQYSVAELVRHGPREFLRRFELQNAHLSFVALPPKDPSRGRSRSLAEDLYNLLGQPALLAESTRIENFNLKLQTPKGEVRLRGGQLLLDPERPGFIRLERLEIPNFPVWENLEGVTTYHHHKAHLERIEIADQVTLDGADFEHDQSRRQARMVARGHLFGGTAEVTLTGTRFLHQDLPSTYETALILEAKEISLLQATQYLNKPKFPLRVVESLSLSMSGDPEKPQTWFGRAICRGRGLGIGRVEIEKLEASAQVQAGRVEIEAGKAALGQNRVQLSATAQLPAKVIDLKKTDLEGALALECPDLGTFTPTLTNPARGVISGEGTISLHQEVFQSELNLRLKKIQQDLAGIHSGWLQLRVRKVLPKEPTPAFEGLSLRVEADLEGFQIKGLQTDAARLSLESEGQMLHVLNLELGRGENHIFGKGTYRIPRDKSEIAAAPIAGEFTLKAPKLEEFGFEWKDSVLRGRIQGEGHLERTNQILSGTLTLDGTHLELAGLDIARLAVQATAANGELSVEQFVFQINAKDRIALMGKAMLAPPLRYEGGAIISIRDLSIFEPLLDTLGVHQALGGNLQIDWNGKSEGDQSLQSGDFGLVLKQGQFGKIELNEVKIAGIYGPGFLETTQFHFQREQSQLDAGVEIRDGRLRLKDLALQQGKMTVLTGFALLPFDLAHPKTLFPLDQRIAANINTKDLDLENLLSSFGHSTPLNGKFSASLIAGGTLIQPSAHFKLNGSNLRAKALPQFESATLEFNAHYSQKLLSLEAALRQPQAQTLTLKGQAPFDLESTIQEKRIDREMPLDISLKLPSTSLAVLPKLLPSVRRIEGNAGIDVHLGGTINKPVLSGAAQAEIKSARLNQESIPALGDIRANLVFDGETLQFKTLRGEIGGGTFDLGGAVNIAQLKNPLFNLRLKSKDVLVRRDDSITVRIDTDLKLDGPLQSATTKGEIFITNSRFFREIDILPIGLPGRPKPKPRAAPASRSFSLLNPPFRDWKFDVAIRTHPKDPFRIRGNLANGGAAMDLKLAGTGLQPEFSGTVSVDNFVASLPFSKLSVTQGYIYFTPQSPFEPVLDLQAESQVRDYRVYAYIYGNTNDPQVSLSSEPPLPQADIVSLLATGTTTTELTGKSDVLAGRAAVLVFQELYRKVFKKREPSEQDTLWDRFDLDVGAVDNRTGKQEVSARFKLGEQFYLIGDLDVSGNFTGRLRYLLRFR